jgi:hypothetical protein
MKPGYRFWNTLKHSISDIDLRVFVIALHDFLFVALAFASLFLWGYLVQWKSAIVQFNPYNLDVTNKAMLNITVESLQSLLVFFLISMTVMFVVFVLLYSFFEGMVWLTVMRKKPSWRFFWKFAVLNAIWFVGWLIVLIAAMFLFRSGVALFLLAVIIFLLLHLTLIQAIHFARTNEIKKTLKNTFLVGFKKIHHFIFPYIVILVGYAVALLIGWPIELILRQFSQATFQITDMTVFIIITMLYLACARIYLANVVKG